LHKHVIILFESNSLGRGCGKKPLGFKTPSMQIQEEYKEILEQITAKKTDWEKLFAASNKLYEYVYSGSGDIIKETESEEVNHESLMEIEHRVSLLAIVSTQLIGARVGKELSECDIKISEVERELKALRRALK